ncbi:twin-arginine translocase TatA/TatE family subunit [Croceibacterium sp. TMG7-5b_MA50]|uniref:twin-arginine translocase TatA/TatE family subunit n=1 Tax=Croceibacterium sp. TMG7-5b_MA50 TaxID=3121290 RepID=UPI003221B7BF
MVSLGPFQILIIALVILVLFGRGRISEMMGDFGKGVKSFRQGLSEEDAKTDPPASPQRIEGPVTRTATPATPNETVVEAPADKTSV